jgi:hypothetical protein
MNTFGIDYQPTVTMIALREDGRESLETASVGDGVRTMIPNVVAPGGLWGSGAEKRAGKVSAQAADSAWIEEPGARFFWEGMYARLSSYLGRLAPLRKNGYRLSIALQGANYSTDAHAVAGLARAAGFDDFVLTPCTHALLCRWLASSALEVEPPRTIVTIAVGESSTMVSAFQIEWRFRIAPAIQAASVPICLEESGFATWNGRLLELLRERSSEPPPEGQERALRDAAFRFAVRLEQAAENQRVEWFEMFADRLFAPLSLSYSDCIAWPEAVAFARQLPEAVCNSLRNIGSAKGDVLVVGGVGSVWPFAERITAKLGRVWRSGAAGDDVAAGATLWGDLCEHPSGMLLDASPSTETGPSLPATTGGHATESRTSLPPWERENADAG